MMKTICNCKSFDFKTNPEYSRSSLDFVPFTFKFEKKYIYLSIKKNLDSALLVIRENEFKTILCYVFTKNNGSENSGDITEDIFCDHDEIFLTIEDVKILQEISQQVTGDGFLRCLKKLGFKIDV